MIVLRVGLFAFGVDGSFVGLAVGQLTLDSDVPSIDNQVFALGSSDATRMSVHPPSMNSSAHTFRE